MQHESVQETTRYGRQVVTCGAPVLSVEVGAVPALDEATACAPWLVPVTYHAIDIDEAPHKPRFDCRKVPVRLTVMGAGDALLCATEGLTALNRVRVQRIACEAIAEGGILTQQDLAFLLGTSLESIADILAGYDEHGQSLPYRGENHA